MARLAILAKLLCAFGLLGLIAGALARERSEPALRDRPRRPAMTFERVSSGEVRWIAASGRIAEETPEAFARFLAENDLAGHTVYLDSFGGRLSAAMQLGRMFRQAGLTVSVGRTFAGPGGPVLVTHSIACNSACVYALMGGAERRVSASARLGVHQFSGRQSHSGHVLDPSYGVEEFRFAQLQTARLAVYMQEMGVDLRLLERMHAVPHGAPLQYLSRSDIEEMRLARVEPTPPPAAPVGWLMFSRRDDPMLYARRLHIEGVRRVGDEIALRCGRGADHHLTIRRTLEAAGDRVAIDWQHVRVSAARTAHVWSAPPGEPVRFAGPRVAAWLYASVPHGLIAEAHESGQLGFEVMSELGGTFGPRQEVGGPSFAAASARFLDACGGRERAALIR